MTILGIDRKKDILPNSLNQDVFTFLLFS